MRLWLDVHLPPAIGPWISEKFRIEVMAFRDHGWSREPDDSVFSKLAVKGEVVMTKDTDFVQLVEALGPPPQVIWLTCGNTSNRNLRRILARTLGTSLELLDNGEPLVELR